MARSVRLGVGSGLVSKRRWRKPSNNANEHATGIVKQSCALPQFAPARGNDGVAPRVGPAMQTKVARGPAIVLKLGLRTRNNDIARDGNDQGHSRVRRLHPVAPPAAQGDRRDARLVQPGAQGPGQGRARVLQLGRGPRDHGGRGRARRAGRPRPGHDRARCASPPPPFRSSTGCIRASSPAP